MTVSRKVRKGERGRKGKKVRKREIYDLPSLIILCFYCFCFPSGTFLWMIQTVRDCAVTDICGWWTGQSHPKLTKHLFCLFVLRNDAFMELAVSLEKKKKIIVSFIFLLYLWSDWRDLCLWNLFPMDKKRKKEV